MADNDNEEYKLEDPDIFSVEPEPQTESTEVPKSQNFASELDIKRILRHGLIVVGAIFLLLFFYKVITSYISNKKVGNSQMIMPVTPNKEKIQKQAAPMPLMEPNTPVELKAKESQLNKIEQEQQTIESEVTVVSTQLNGINTSIEGMTKKIDELNQAILLLAEKLEMQSKEMLRLQALQARPPRPRVRTPAPARQAMTRYFLQAIIPGRAWLVVENGGATITVREGTPLPGYGVVRLIDPIQGRVVTSSGQVIQFSQNDS